MRSEPYLLHVLRITPKLGLRFARSGGTLKAFIPVYSTSYDLGLSTGKPSHLTGRGHSKGFCVYR